MSIFYYVIFLLLGIIIISTSVDITDELRVRQMSPYKTMSLFDSSGTSYLWNLPSSNALITDKLANGTDISLMSETGDWYQVKTKNNKVGFIHKENTIIYE